MQTLAIASAASVAAATVTSRLFPPGAVFTAALTPVIVAMVSEVLHRPVTRMTELREARRTMTHEAELLRAARTGRELPGEGGAWTDPLAGAPAPFDRGDRVEQPSGNGRGRAGDVSYHGRRRWGRIHPRVAIATGLLAFVIAAAALTLPELLFGGAVANSHRTTLFGGGRQKTTAEPKKQETETTPAATTTETAPAEEPAQTTTDTTPQPTETETAPSGGTPAPEPTTTDTTTTPAQTPPSG